MVRKLSFCSGSRTSSIGKRIAAEVCPRLHDRRDRQDGDRLPRRSFERDARGSRPGAERELQGPLPRPALRPLEGDVHHDRQRARGDPGASERSHGGDPARRLHGRGEEGDRPPLPGPAPDRAQRSEPAPDRDQGRGDRRHHRGVHARGRRAKPRARDRVGRRKVAREFAEGRAKRRSRSTRPRHGRCSASGATSPSKRRTSEPGVATGLAWTPVGGEVLFVEATDYPRHAAS